MRFSFSLAAAIVVLVTTLPAQEGNIENGPSTSDWRARFGEGRGPMLRDGVFHLLDGPGAPGAAEGTFFDQSNAVAFVRPAAGPRDRMTLRCDLRVLEGGDGGAFLFLNTAEYGHRGPPPFVPHWPAPDLRRSLAVGVDVHDPPNSEPFGEWGNVYENPEREVSLHWDGREIVKRLVDAEFRGDWAALAVDVVTVCGGAEVTVRIGEATVYDRFVVAGLTPYESRLAIGAGTRSDVATEFDVRDIEFTVGEPAETPRAPLHVDLFNAVLTDNAKTSFETEVDLPPLSWAFGRVTLTLEIHDAGRDWDEWDRNGHFFVRDDAGVWRDIAPFITSYRTPCHWTVDLTHFRPWLHGRRAFKIEAGTNFYKDRGYQMSASIDFHHGTPVVDGVPAIPAQVVPLWVGTANHGAPENHFADFFEPRTVEIPADTTAARIATTTTGHSQVGEFTPSDRTILFRPDAGAEAVHAFENTLWRDDCYLNPNRPQFGTWKYSRAGWAPGDVVRPWWIELTPHLEPGRTAEFRYVPEPYDFTEVPEEQRPEEGQVRQASHVIRAYLILYAPVDGLVAAPILRVTNVAGGSNAAAAGIREGDYLESYDGVVVDSIDALSAAKKAATDGGKSAVPVIVHRGSERLELELPVGQLGVNLSTD